MSALSYEPRGILRGKELDIEWYVLPLRFWRHWFHWFKCSNWGLTLHRQFDGGSLTGTWMLRAGPLTVMRNGKGYR